MIKEDVEKLALSLMDEHGLVGWKLKFNNRNRKLGICHYGKKTIFLSQPLMEINDDSIVRETILHEIAHALLSIRDGHGPIWKQKALSIGCQFASSRGINAVLSKGKFVYKCINCGEEYQFYRIKKRLGACASCCHKYNGGKFDKKYVIKEVTQ